MRHQKHHAASAAVAATLVRRLNRSIVLHINRDAKTPGGISINSSIEQIVRGTEGLSLRHIDWQRADQFRRTIARMHLCLQLSSSETFNLVTADATAAGVPSVVGEVIDWVPPDWVAPIDDPIAAAEVAIKILADPTAGARGQDALKVYAEDALKIWKDTVDNKVI